MDSNADLRYHGSFLSVRIAVRTVLSPTHHDESTTSRSPACSSPRRIRFSPDLLRAWRPCESTHRTSCPASTATGGQGDGASHLWGLTSCRTPPAGCDGRRRGTPG